MHGYISGIALNSNLKSNDKIIRFCGRSTPSSWIERIEYCTVILIAAYTSKNIHERRVPLYFYFARSRTILVISSFQIRYSIFSIVEKCYLGYRNKFRVSRYYKVEWSKGFDEIILFSYDYSDLDFFIIVE